MSDDKALLVALALRDEMIRQNHSLEPLGETEAHCEDSGVTYDCMEIARAAIRAAGLTP